MARIDNKLLFFTTSPRTPAKMIPEIKLLSAQIAITSWTPRGKNLGHGWSRRIYP